MSANGYYKYPCAHRNTYDCPNFVWVNGSTCVDCLCKGREAPVATNPISYRNSNSSGTKPKKSSKTQSSSSGSGSKSSSSNGKNSDSKDKSKDSSSGSKSSSSK